MKKWLILNISVMILGLVSACSPGPGSGTESLQKAILTPNPVETSKPILGGTIECGLALPKNFDPYQLTSGGPVGALPVFNQLVIFDLNYKETIPETVVGDLADSWERSTDGREIVFHLHQGVKWHDGLPFTADDVIYSLDKMTDPNRSAISDWFPAYDSTEMIDDYTVKVHLKYPSVSFLTSLAQGESVIEAQHLASVNSKSADFLVGTGPFMFEDYKALNYLKLRANPDYFKKDKYGNQLPYLDRVVFRQMTEDAADNALVNRKLDLISPAGGTSDITHYIQYWENFAPDLLYQQRDASNIVLFLNTKHSPLDDIRVRRAIGLVLIQEDIITRLGGDPEDYELPIGFLDPGIGLPKDEISQLLGSGNLTYQQRVSEAKKLMGLAGFGNGFKFNILAAGTTTQEDVGISMLIAEVLRKYLGIDAIISAGLKPNELQASLQNGSYDAFITYLDLRDPIQLVDYFGTNGQMNFSNYSNADLDILLSGLDGTLDLVTREKTILEIERILLIDKPALPTGAMLQVMVPYYPQVKNFRVNNVAYSNICRMEDVWLDESLRIK